MTSKYELQYNKICKECPFPTDLQISLTDSVGKTIKFSKQINAACIQVCLIIFEDGTFLLMDFSLNHGFSDSNILNIPHDSNVQDLLINGKILTRKSVDKWNDFFNKRNKINSKKVEMTKLKKLIKKYPTESNNILNKKK